MTRQLYTLMWCSLFVFAACTPTPTPQEQTAKDSSIASSASADTSTMSKPPRNNDTTVIYQFLRDSMPTWVIPQGSTWEKYWYERYKKGRNTVYRVQEDFDGNGLTDYAFILKDSKDQYAVWAFMQKGNTFSPYRIYDITRLPGRRLHVGLGALEAGSYPDLNSIDSIPAKVVTEHSAIHVIFFETAAKAYYWKNGGFHLIQTGD